MPRTAWLSPSWLRDLARDTPGLRYAVLERAVEEGEIESNAAGEINAGSLGLWLDRHGFGDKLQGRKDANVVGTPNHTHPPIFSHAGPAPRNEYGEVLENLVTMAECARLVGVSASDIERLVAGEKVRTHGMARLVDPAEVTRALSEFRAPKPEAATPSTPLARPRPDGPQAEVGLRPSAANPVIAGAEVRDSEAFHKAKAAVIEARVAQDLARLQKRTRAQDTKEPHVAEDFEMFPDAWPGPRCVRIPDRQQQSVERARRNYRRASGGFDYGAYFRAHPERYGPGSKWTDPEDLDVEIDVEGLCEP